LCGKESMAKKLRKQKLILLISMVCIVQMMQLVQNHFGTFHDTETKDKSWSRNEKERNGVGANIECNEKIQPYIWELLDNIL